MTIVLILAVAFVGALLKAAGPLTVARGAPAPAAQRVTMLLPATLLTGLVVATVLGMRWASLDLAVVAGVGVAGVAAARRVPVLVAIALACATTALIRMI